MFQKIKLKLFFKHCWQAGRYKSVCFNVTVVVLLAVVLLAASNRCCNCNSCDVEHVQSIILFSARFFFFLFFFFCFSLFQPTSAPLNIFYFLFGGLSDNQLQNNERLVVGRTLHSVCCSDICVLKFGIEKHIKYRPMNYGSINAIHLFFTQIIPEIIL